MLYTSTTTTTFVNANVNANAIGINYGQIANNLPSPQNVIPLLKSIGATRVKLYDADPRVLRAFANTGVQFVVGLGNEYLSKMSTSPEAAQAWVKSNVQPYLPATNITSITVGNEVLTFNDTSLSGCLFPAMQNVHTALANLGLDKQVTVTTAHSLAILETSYPPSSGSFRRDLRGCITQILDFHTKTGSPLLVNAYPFFAYKGNPKQVSLDYVLFQSSTTTTKNNAAGAGILDPVSNLHYDNMLFAQIDAVYVAMAALGFKKSPSVQISETGWPSKGDEDEVGASPENASKYNSNLMKLVMQNKGTPMRPNTKLDVYVFALFNENMKPGPSSERNYGLFKPDGTPAYQLTGISSTRSDDNLNKTTGGGASSSKTNTSASSPPDTSSTGYLSISSATVVSSYITLCTFQLWILFIGFLYYSPA
ncbi:Glucan endo-1,3-beta-glucosidase [Thalictrum thalictroides]|uniref:glucan endo-1,3-beta-D-glucosidase n=1 Tax=Thalictrum thalictroides TaxID=46969 RepID=A0A7J6WZH0_THATH|nr:Glucan endo-1,3-beta-glucosidase [Thalictrum thalictroides]